jgi:hypothetical protein
LDGDFFRKKSVRNLCRADRDLGEDRKGKLLSSQDRRIPGLRCGRVITILWKKATRCLLWIILKSRT